MLCLPDDFDIIRPTPSVDSRKHKPIKSAIAGTKQQRRRKAQNKQAKGSRRKNRRNK